VGQCSISAIEGPKWRERGAPPVTAPIQPGYGLSLTHDLVPWSAADGIVEYTTHPVGRRYSFYHSYILNESFDFQSYAKAT
jgi:hypothetical protein